MRLFFKSEAASGVVLLFAAVVAIVVANSPAHDAYHAILSYGLGPLSVEQWVNDGLMALFFFVVGMEIKSELVDGALSSRDRALLPALGALGGMIVPALVYLVFQFDRGWGVPMATDIAFAVGVLSLFKVRPQLKVFLLALAIVDDLGAVLVIAFFYTAKIHPLYLLAASVAALGAYFTRSVLFLVCAVACWWLVHLSGVHATIAGCVLGFLVRDPRKLAARLHPYSAFVIMPIFAMANAGIVVSDLFISAPVTHGVSVGLLVGKPIGIFGACWLAVRFGLARMDFSFRELFAAACLGGIGFTMSIFIAQLAFADASVLALAKIGIVRGSVLSALLGVLVLAMTKSKRQSPPLPVTP